MRHRESTVDCTNGNVTQVRAALNNTSTGDHRPGLLRQRQPADRSPDRRTRTASGTGWTTPTTRGGHHVASIMDSFGYRRLTYVQPKFGMVETTTDGTARWSATPTTRLAGSQVTGPYEAPEDRVTIDFEYHPRGDGAVRGHPARRPAGRRVVRTDTLDTITFVDGSTGDPDQEGRRGVDRAGQRRPPTSMVVSGRLAFDFLGRTVKQFFPVTEPKGSANTTFNADLRLGPPTTTTFDVLDRDDQHRPAGQHASPRRLRLRPGPGGRYPVRDRRRPTPTARPSASTRTCGNAGRRQGEQPGRRPERHLDQLRLRRAGPGDVHRGRQEQHDHDGVRQPRPPDRVTTSPDSGRTDLVYDLAGNMTSRRSPPSSPPAGRPSSTTMTSTG